MTINIDRDERRKLAAVAAANERPLAAEARLAIRRHIEAELAAIKGKR